MGFSAWRPGRRRWQVAAPFDRADQMARQLGTAPLVAQILHNRGIDGVEAGESFLDPKLTDLHDPAMLPGAQEAAKRIARAVADKEPIVIHGDYDVDGMTAVAILHACLTMVGARVDYYVPHRLAEGYGVNAEAMRKIISGGAKLVITVDCGISAVEPIAEARAAGVDVIVTDHHSLPEQLPNATAIVHPAVAGGEYPNPDLAGAGVAFKLAWQVARETCGRDKVDDEMRDFLLNATCLAALGTIADVVPLLGENRALAVYGLRGLPASRHVGIQALIESAGLTGQGIDAYHVGFVLAPRLNACGRMGHARDAVELLLGKDAARCREIADDLTRKNTERQKTEREITAQAIEMVQSAGLADKEHRAIVLADPQWHGGVVGIVASRLVGRFGRPAIVIALGAGGGQGSARSIAGFHMRDALAACGEHLESFGGHAMAGGLRIAADKIDAFTAAMLDHARAQITERQLVPTLDIDAETTLAALDYKMVEHLGHLGPYGHGNSPPLVAVRRCKVVTPPKRMGRSGATAGMILAQGDTTMRAVGFGMGDLADLLAGINMVDVAAQPVLNTFNRRTTIELKLKDVCW